MFWAIRHDHWKAAVILLDRGAHIDCKDRDGYTPLIWAASTGRVTIHTHCTTLYLYPYIHSRVGHLDTVGLLLERGAGMEERTADGYTALIVAARWGRTDIVSLLLEVGANGRARDEFGKSAAYYARKEGRLAALQLLQKHVSVVKAPTTSPMPSSPPFRRYKV